MRLLETILRDIEAQEKVCATAQAKLDRLKLELFETVKEMGIS